MRRFPSYAEIPREVWVTNHDGVSDFRLKVEKICICRYDGGGDVGRMGHGLGTQLTEWPSLVKQTQQDAAEKVFCFNVLMFFQMASDETVLEPGMALAIEPGVSFGNGLCMVCPRASQPFRG